MGEVDIWNICSWGAVLCYIHEPWRGCWPPSRGSFDWFATVISADRWPWLPSRHAPAPRQACTRVPAPLLSRCAMSPEFTQLSIPCTCQVQLSTLSFTGVLLIRAAPSNAPGRWGKCGSKPCENQHDQPGGRATSGAQFFSITACPATIRIVPGSSHHPPSPPQVAFMPRRARRPRSRCPTVSAR